MFLRGALQLQNIMLMLADENDVDLAMLRTSDIALRATQHGEVLTIAFGLGALSVDDRTQPHDSRSFRLIDSTRYVEYLKSPCVSFHPIPSAPASAARMNLISPSAFGSSRTRF